MILYTNISHGFFAAATSDAATYIYIYTHSNVYSHLYIYICIHINVCMYEMCIYRNMCKINIEMNYI